MKLNPTKTPGKLTREIIDGCKRLVADATPVFVERRPAPGAQVNKCTLNVRGYLEEHPGSMVLGWDISVWDNVLLDCIGHAVAKTDDGLLRVSPSKYGETSLLFLPDNSLEFDFNNSMARMPSKRISLSTKPEVREFIDVEAEELLIRSKYPVSSGQIAVRGADALELQKLGYWDKDDAKMTTFFSRPRANSTTVRILTSTPPSLVGTSSRQSRCNFSC